MSPPVDAVDSNAVGPDAVDCDAIDPEATDGGLADSAFAALVEDRFRGIAATRMRDIPILHPSIGVSLHGLRRWNDHRLGILVTPWFMNAVLFPCDPANETLRVGTKRTFILPAGPYEFIRYEEDGIGAYWGCSLFSPMFEFADDDAAQATADAAIELLMTPEPATQPEAQPEIQSETGPADTAPARGPVSRRALLGLNAHENAPESAHEHRA